MVGKHRDLVAAGLQLQAWLAPVSGPAKAGRHQGSGDVALLPLPLFHVYACVGVQSHALVSRTPLALVPNPRDIDDLLQTIERVKPTLFSAVPALFIALLNHPRVQARKVDFSSIRACFSGAAPLLAATKSRFEELSGGRIVEGYSLTEAMMACVVNPLGGAGKLGSVGLPLPDIEVAIVDADSGERLLPPGETGEIILRGPQLMSGYWNNPEETARALRRHDDGAAWLHTGDLGYLDEDSYLFIVDRQKDLIKTSGYQVWPREIEEALASHPGVMDVGVAGIADDVKGEVVKAWVVRKPGATPTSDELRTYCRSKLAPFKVPAQIEFRESLPKTMAGKVLRRALRARRKGSGSLFDREPFPTPKKRSHRNARLLQSRAHRRRRVRRVWRVAVHADGVDLSRKGRAIARHHFFVADHANRSLGGAARFAQDRIGEMPGRQRAVRLVRSIGKRFGGHAQPQPAAGGQQLGRRQANQHQRLVERRHRTRNGFRHFLVARAHVVQRAVRLDVLKARAFRFGHRAQRADLIEHEIEDFLRIGVDLAPAEADEIRKAGMRADGHAGSAPPAVPSAASRTDRPREIRTRCCPT